MTEMYEDNEVRALLSQASAPDSRLNLDDVLRNGRRRLRQRRTAGVVGVSALAVAGVVVAPLAVRAVAASNHTAQLAGPPGAVASATGASNSVGPSPSATPDSPACTVSALPVPPGATSVEATAVDPTGRYIGGVYWSGQNAVPVLWTDGHPQVLPVHVQSATVDAVNAHGVVVGVVDNGPDEYVYKYENGTVTELRPLAGYPHVFPAPTLDDAGNVAINGEPADGAGGEHSVAMIWPAGSVTAQKLPLPAAANIFALTDDGTRVGTTYVNGLAESGYAWDAAGQGRKLATPAGDRSTGYGAHGDWATGDVFAADGHGTAARWNLRTGAVTVLDADGPGFAVNASGWVVTGVGLVRDKALVPLAPLTPGGKVRPRAIADTNLVVGQSSSTTAQPAAWQC